MAGLFHNTFRLITCTKHNIEMPINLILSFIVLRLHLKVHHVLAMVVCSSVFVPYELATDVTTPIIDQA
jgi:hypothetical protein